MEELHDVDVSWLHHSHKDHQLQRSPSEIRDSSGKMNLKGHDRGSATTEMHYGTGDNPVSISNGDSSPHHHHHVHKPHIHIRPSPESPNTSSPTTPKSGKDKQPSPSLVRRGSWISSLSSKFSSAPQSPSTPTPSPAKLPSSPPNEQSGSNTPGSPSPRDIKKNDSVAQAPSSPRSNGPSFLQSALRRLSSTGASSLGKMSGNGGVCPRRTYNVDIHRDRCQVEDLQPAKLRRVAFCVDVEIASAVRYSDDNEDEMLEPSTPVRRPSLTELERHVNHNKTKEQRQKMNDKAEAEALKNPQAVAAAKEEEKDGRSMEDKVTETQNPVVEKAPNVEQPTRKKEKKKKSEEERKERKEKKRLAAVANGTIPIEITRESSYSDSSTRGSPSPRLQDRPTTDSLRIYRRCCQLRETPVLKRITEQLASPSACDPLANGSVTCLDLTGSRMQLSDMVTLGDYLAVVPVKKLILEDCGLSDEGLRVVLAGLLAVKTTSQAKFNKELAKRLGRDRTLDESEATERLGVVEKVSLKNNPKLGRDGWRHIALFIHMSRSLKAIDLSMIPFPSQNSTQAVHGTHLKPRTPTKLPIGLSCIFEKCLVERLAGSHLEELVMAECGLNAEHIQNIIHGVITCGITRLGLANNNLTAESMEEVARYVKTGKCEGLDLGGNDISSNGLLDILVNAIDVEGSSGGNPLYALSLADCKLSTSDIKVLLPVLAKLPNFRFIDLSHNRSLFSIQPNAIAVLRKYLPRMNALKRVHLNDVAMESEHCIALAEILPEVSNLAHLSLLENESLTELASASDEASQEEACALYASLMAAVRVSDSIICIDIDVPTQESGEMVQALAKQVVAYSLRNMERGPIAEAFTGNGDTAQDSDRLVQVPDILLHLVGHVDGFPENHDEDEPAPDADYIVGGTGVVKALSVCLGNKAADYRRLSRDSTPAPSGTVTPKQDVENVQVAKGKAMSKNLLGSARKIKARLQPALAREAKQGDDLAYRRLQFLDSTLERIIQRFEDEYPECRLTRPTRTKPPREASSDSGGPQSSALFQNPFSDGTQVDAVDEMVEGADDDDDAPIRVPMTRHDSDVSVASKHLTIEEGRMHRFGQQVKRDILRPQATNDHDIGSGDGDEEESDHVQLLRSKLEALSGQEIKDLVGEHGTDALLARLGASAEELLRLKVEDPKEFEKFREAQLHAQRNMGKSDPGRRGGEMVA